LLHLWALVLAVPAALALMWHDPVAPTMVYASALVVLYAISTAYHRLPLDPDRRLLLRRADHAMIYLFTAACYTPFCVLAVPGTLGLVVLAVAWLGALAGVAIKVLGFGRLPITGSVLYLVLGFLAAVTLPGTSRVLDGTELGLILASGLVYVSGSVVLFTRRPDPIPHVFGYHEIWHGCVVLASSLYFVAVWEMAGLAH
jgi:hemolysin III